MGYVIAAMVGSAFAMIYFLFDRIKRQNDSLYEALTKCDDIIKIQGDELERRKRVIEDQERRIQYQGDIINKQGALYGEGGSSSTT